MAMLLSRKILFYNKLGRELHKSVLVFSTSKDTVFKDTMDVKDVKPAIINTILTSPELAELPEVSWEKNIGYNSSVKNCLKVVKTSKKIYIPKDNAMFQDKEEFQDVMDEVKNTFMSSSKLNQQPDVRSWFKNLLDYTLEGGKRGRGHCVVFAYKMLENPENITEQTLHTARVLACCVEMLQAFLLVTDDIIDASTTRRGKPCWHLLPNVGAAAINDSVLIYQALMEVLDIKFGKTSIYIDMIRIINETVLYTSMGEHLDCSSSYNKGKSNIDTFTMDRFDNIAILKTGYYSFRMPILVALLLVKNGKERYTEEFNHICFELGRLLQFQNDYKDVYVDETSTGKAGTDIQEGKLTWFAVKALELCNQSQRSVFKEYYGSKNPEHVKRIKQLYDEIQLLQVYKQYERTVNDDLVRRMNALSTEGEKQLFLEILNACNKQIF